jgi:hypothetical protein
MSNSSSTVSDRKTAIALQGPPSEQVAAEVPV